MSEENRTDTAQPRHEILVALRVTDEAGYDAYRAHMTPLLHKAGGFFRRDYRVSESLAGGDAAVNRVFVISFPSEAVKDAFFADPEYGRIRERYFSASVDHTDIIGAFDHPGEDDAQA